MMSRVDKLQVRQRFKKSLTTYNHQAQVQNRMAGLLLEIVCQKIGTKFGRVLEIGAGTGLLSVKIRERLQVGCFWANDLVPEAEPYVLAAFPGAGFIPGDVEHLPGLPGQLDLILSNATFQWMADPSAFLAKLRGLLAPGGHLVFSSFGPDNFREINRLLQTGLAYPGFQELRRICEQHYRVVYAHEENVALHFQDLFAVMKHMQSLGVNGVKRHYWSRASWHDLAQRYYETFGTQRGLPLTYHPFYFALAAA